MDCSQMEGAPPSSVDDNVSLPSNQLDLDLEAATSRSQMDNLQVRGLLNGAARPNASNPGPYSSLQSQNRGLNTQQGQEEFERANDLIGGGIELPPDTPDDPDKLNKLKGSKSRDMVDDLKSGWTLLLTNLILEIASAVFDQLGYALVGMVLAFVALLLSTAELIHMARKERMRLLPSSPRPSTRTLAPGKPVDTIAEYLGLVGAVWQCFYSTVEYAYARQKRENPIKMCLLPFIFLLCVVIFKLSNKAAEFGDLKMKRSVSEKAASLDLAEEVMREKIERKRPAMTRALDKTMLVGDEGGVDANADDFINKFKQQLKLQSQHSLLRYKGMLNRRQKI